MKYLISILLPLSLTASIDYPKNLYEIKENLCRSLEIARGSQQCLSPNDYYYHFFDGYAHGLIHAIVLIEKQIQREE